MGAPDGGATLRQVDVTLLSVMARYQITPSVSVQFNSDNLLDEKYSCWMNTTTRITAHWSTTR